MNNDEKIQILETKIKDLESALAEHKKPLLDRKGVPFLTWFEVGVFFGLLTPFFRYMLT